LYKVIARGRYDTAMAGWGVAEGGVYTDYQIEELIALIRYGDWAEVNELAAAQGLIPPTLPVPQVDEGTLEQVAALAPAGEQWAEGMTLYANNCATCHGVNGEGSDLGVPLNTAEVAATAAAELTRLINEGVPGTMMAGWDNTLPAADVAALVAFLTNWDAIAAAGVEMAPPAPIQINLDNPDEVLALGERIFNAACASCHGENGGGGTGPALNSQQFLTGKDDDAILSAIVNGGRRPRSTMPAFGDRLTTVELAALVDYIRAWEPTAPLVENPRGTAQGGGPPWLRNDGETISPGGGQGAQGRGNPGNQGSGGRGQGQGRGQGGPAWRDAAPPPVQQGENTPGAGLDLPNHQGETLQFRGVVLAVEGNRLTFQTEAGERREAMLGPPWFWAENGIPLAPGDQIELEGFAATDHMEINWLQNLSSGRRINLRTPTGQPVWGGSE
jgi:mono/diheme cytochrome c family protein